MCSSCDRTIWEVGHKGRVYFAAFLQQSAKFRNQFYAFFHVHVVLDKRFSTILQSCNAKVTFRKLSKLSPNHGDLDRLFDFDIQGRVH